MIQIFRSDMVVSLFRVCDPGGTVRAGHGEPGNAGHLGMVGFFSSVVWVFAQSIFLGKADSAQ